MANLILQLAEIYELYYPELKEVVAEEGMESILNDMFLIYRNHENPTAFSPTYNHLEILKKIKYFKVKQTIDAERKIGNNYDYDQIYFIDFIKEEDKRRFAGAEKQ